MQISQLADGTVGSDGAESFADRVRRQTEEGERVIREFERAERAMCDVAGMDAMVRSFQFVDQISTEVNSTVAKLTTTLPSVMLRAEEASLQTLVTSVLSPLDNVSTSLAFDIAEDVRQRSIELSERIAELSKPVKLPDDYLDRLCQIEVPDRFDLTKLEHLKFPKNCSFSALREMTDDEIEGFLDGDISIMASEMALHERAMRRIDRATKPHWSVAWTFWLVVASFLFTVINLLLALRWVR